MALALLVGAVTAGPSLVLVALLARVLLGPEPTTLSLVLLAVGAPTLAAVGGWCIYPLLTKVGRRPDRG